MSTFCCFSFPWFLPGQLLWWSEFQVVIGDDFENGNHVPRTTEHKDWRLLGRLMSCYLPWMLRSILILCERNKTKCNKNPHTVFQFLFFYQAVSEVSTGLLGLQIEGETWRYGKGLKPGGKDLRVRAQRWELEPHLWLRSLSCYCLMSNPILPVPYKTWREREEQKRDRREPTASQAEVEERKVAREYEGAFRSRRGRVNYTQENKRI